MKTIQRALIATSLIGAIPAIAANESATTAEPTPSSSSATGLLVGKFPGETAMDRAWSAATLYKDENNPILQEFSLQGRVQVQYADGDSGNGHFDIEDFKDAGKDEAVWGDKFEARRLYFGAKTRWFNVWKLEGQIDVDTDGLDGPGGLDDPGSDHTLYKDIYDLYLTYAPSDAFNASIGKQELKITREQEISSKEIVTLERSLVANMVHPGNLTGAWVNGKGIQDHWLYEAGFYANDQVREFSQFDGGALFLGKLGYDYSAKACLDSAVVSFRYAHNTQPGFKDEQSETNFTPSSSPNFSDTLVLSNDLIQGRFGLTTDLIYGCGFNGSAEQGGIDTPIAQSDVAAIDIIPTYFIADGLQLVGRVQLATAMDPDGLGLQSRYEAVGPSDDKKGNTYASAYAGLNYYIYGHKLKLMNGIEYTTLGGGDFDGYTFFSGLRGYF